MGGCHLIQKGFIRKNEIFGHILPKRGDFVRKKLRIFRNFWSKGGGGLRQSKISLNRKNSGIQIVCIGGGSRFFGIFPKKKKQFFYASPYSVTEKLIPFHSVTWKTPQLKTLQVSTKKRQLLTEPLPKTNSPENFSRICGKRGRL